MQVVELSADGPALAVERKADEDEDHDVEKVDDELACAQRTQKESEGIREDHDVENVHDELVCARRTSGGRQDVIGRSSGSHIGGR